MAQHDYIISNQTFPSYRNDHNNSLTAIVGKNSGSSEPATKYAYQWWYDSSNNILKIRNADNDAWINFATFDQTNDRFSLSVHDLTVTGSGVIPAGTVMLFQQTSAPTGFTKITTQNNKALRVVSGSASTGGSNSFTNSLNTSKTVSGTTGGTAVTITGSVGSHTLTIAEMPAHDHPRGTHSTVGFTDDGGAGGTQGYVGGDQNVGSFDARLASQGGGQGHTHNVGSLAGSSHTHSFSSSFNLDVQYVDVILASKD
jgi:hypothetical protein